MEGKTVEELKRFLKKNKASGYSKMNKDELVKFAKKVQRGSAETNVVNYNQPMNVNNQIKGLSLNDLRKEYKKIKIIKNKVHGAPTVTRTISVMNSTPQNAINEQGRAIMENEIRRFYQQYNSNSNYRTQVNRVINEGNNSNVRNNNINTPNYSTVSNNNMR